MKILYIHQYFKTPREPGATRIYFIVQQLIKEGHNVTVITQNKKITASNREEMYIDGINIVYLKNAYSNEMSIPMRIKSFFNFMYKSSFEVFKHKNIDLVIATSTPLSVGLPALLLKKIKGIPFVFEVRDLWPEVPIQMGGLKNPLVKKIAIWFEKTIYKNASHIVALSPGMFDGVVKYVPSEKVSMIPNMAKKEHFWPREKDKDCIEQLQLRENSFKVIHFGTMGIANGLNYFVEAAKIAYDKGITDVDFILLGEGKAEKNLKLYTEKYKLTNVFFYDRMAMKGTSEVVNICDISVVPFLNIPILSTNSPNKLFDSLAAGKPIIVNSNGWTKKMVEDNSCGAFVDPENPNELFELIMSWKNDPHLLKVMGENSRKLAETTYDESILTKNFASIINTLNNK
jgi:glycosyltransferase involved in cell wall biosynthesis